ncbi:unnamed protein product [Vitrella brassicaformis CCMP3155]|uniref:Uncharacterized protein n=2 Tax=Vitrella brassicaformis TaxID=1169539 RepID=A0A0G4EQQ1_VITBC|nr:unnamed protein product [Vitrella brassicaformis CCMP3155]|eukprot:CEL99792.1 unnamed protein product [Vitrella brassicaformis CCMP3155]
MHASRLVSSCVISCCLRREERRGLLPSIIHGSDLRHTVCTLSKRPLAEASNHIARNGSRDKSVIDTNANHRSAVLVNQEFNREASIAHHGDGRQSAGATIQQWDGRGRPAEG